MHTNSAKQFLPSINNDKKIDVSLEKDEAVIQLSTWTEDLGWLCQKTLRLDSKMLDDLHRVITAARYKLNRQNAENNDEQLARVLKFPLVS